MKRPEPGVVQRLITVMFFPAVFGMARFWWRYLRIASGAEFHYDFLDYYWLTFCLAAIAYRVVEYVLFHKPTPKDELAPPIDEQVILQKIELAELRKELAAVRTAQARATIKAVDDYRGPG